MSQIGFGKPKDDPLWLAVGGLGRRPLRCCRIHRRALFPNMSPAYRRDSLE